MKQKTVIKKLLQSVTEVYYKVRQVLQSVTDCYFKVRRNTGAPSCYLELLDNYKNGYVGLFSSLAASLGPLAHCQNVVSLSLFYRYKSFL